MRRTYFWLAVAIVMAIASSSAFAATTFWLSTDATNGTPLAGDAVTVPFAGTVQLHCFMTTTDPGNTFEVMVGYDTSDASTYGAGVDTNDGASGKLELTSGSVAIDSFFDVFTSTGYAAKQVVEDASGRATEGGRPYGFVARSATFIKNTTGTAKKLFSFTLENKMPEGQSQTVVVSNLAGGNSFSSAWKNGTALGEDSYTLTVNSGAGTAGPVVGATNKAVLDTLMTQTVADSYTWVFWGKVSERTASGFKLDDGSGVTLNVTGTNSVADGNYVAVKGSLNVASKTLTSQTITKY